MFNQTLSISLVRYNGTEQGCVYLRSVCCYISTPQGTDFDNPLVYQYTYCLRPNAMYVPHTSHTAAHAHTRCHRIFSRHMRSELLGLYWHDSGML